MPSIQFHERQFILEGLSLVFARKLSTATTMAKRDRTVDAREMLADAITVLDTVDKAVLL